MLIVVSRITAQDLMRRVLGVVAATLFLAAPATAASAAKRTTVFAVNYPLAYFAKRIGGDAFDVDFPVQIGDPAFWKPTAKDIVKVQSASLILLNGAGYARWTATVSLPRRKRIITSAAAVERYIARKGGAKHSHGPKGAHVHGDVAFTTWLDFDVAALQAAAVHNALARLRPARKPEFSQAFKGLEAELQALDRAMKTLSSKAVGRPIIASHPVYQYLAAAYGLKIVNLHWEPSEMPDEEAWTAFAELRTRLGDTPLMLWEEMPVSAIAARLRGLGIRIAIFRPGGGTPKSGDFISIMQTNIEELAKLLSAPQ